MMLKVHSRLTPYYVLLHRVPNSQIFLNDNNRLGTLNETNRLLGATLLL